MSLVRMPCCGRILKNHAAFDGSDKEPCPGARWRSEDMMHDYYVDNSYTEYGWGKRRMLLTAAERWAGEPDLARWCRRMARHA